MSFNVEALLFPYKKADWWRRSKDFNRDLLLKKMKTALLRVLNKSSLLEPFYQFGTLFGTLSMMKSYGFNEVMDFQISHLNCSYWIIPKSNYSHIRSPSIERVEGTHS